MFDSNMFDNLPNCIDQIISSKVKYEYYVTALQIEELCKIPDSKKDKRTSLITHLAILRPKLIPISTFVLGYAKLGQVKLGDGFEYNKILNKTKSNSADALIASTAVNEGCTLITDDTKLTTKMKNNNYPVMSFSEFIESLK